MSDGFELPADDDIVEPEAAVVIIDRLVRHMATESGVEPNHYNHSVYRLLERLAEELYRWTATGTGYRGNLRAPHLLERGQQIILCKWCSGKGYNDAGLHSDERACHACHGHGRVLQLTQLERLETQPQGATLYGRRVWPQPPPAPQTPAQDA